MTRIDRPADHQPDAECHAEARRLIVAHGWNATVYQILNPGFRLWFSRHAPAVAGYVVAPRRWVVAGAPVCAEADLARACDELEEDARAAGARVVYFAAEDRLHRMHAERPAHAAVLLGAQPAWRPSQWHAAVSHHASLRAQFHRARNKGVHVEQWGAREAQGHPALRACLQEWLDARPLPSLHFLIEPDTLDRLEDRMVLVALQHDHPVGFTIASPIPRRRGWLIEQFVRNAQAPNGTTELMIDAAVQRMADIQSEYVTLGLAPLSRHAIAAPPAPWLRLALAFARAHGTRFYNFAGLDAFKQKFTPEQWEPVYAVSNEPHFTPASLYGIASAFTNRRPLRTLAGGIVRAGAQELRTLRAWATKRPHKQQRRDIS